MFTAKPCCTIEIAVVEVSTNVSADNVQKLRDYKELKLDVSNFTATKAGESSILCRLAETVSTPKGESFEEYIKDALISELKMAGTYDKNSTLKESCYI